MLWKVKGRVISSRKEDEYVNHHILEIYKLGNGRFDSTIALHYLNAERDLKAIGYAD
jgi:hypothetical protein